MEDDQQFCLRWNNHQSTLVAVFDTLLENGTLVDCTLAAEGKYLNAHKVVLSACSPYFESLLSQNYDKHPIFILKDVKYQELKAMMDYMYRGEVNISQDQLGALLKAAESLQIKGLSDNRKGETETRKTAAPPPPPAKSPPPAAATSIPRVQGLTIEQRRREMEESREGSQSPGARKKKRIRRRSLDDLVDNHHDASNSSESHHSSQAPAQNIPTTLPAAPVKIVTDVPEPIETKADILTRHKSTTESEVPQVPIIKEKLETHSELMLEPKAEYIDEMNEDSIEDLTLDDDDISNMEQMDDQGAGPSHGNMGEGSGQGFGGWHMGNQSQDEVFLAAQEAVGAHRDSQGDVDFLYGIESAAPSKEPANETLYNESFWLTYQIPFNRLDSTTLEELCKGTRSKSVKNTVINFVIDDIRKQRTTIPSKWLKIIARKLVDSYPETFKDVDDDEVTLGDGSYSTYQKLLDRNSYLNRPHKRPTGLPSTPKNVKYRKSLTTARAGCVNWQPVNATVPANSIAAIKERLRLAVQKLNILDDKEKKEIITDLETTYYQQRTYINQSQARISDILKEWPILFVHEYMLWHYEKLMGHSVKKISENFRIKKDKLLEFGKRNRLCMEREWDDETSAKETLKVIVGYFKEDLEYLLVEVDRNLDMTQVKTYSPTPTIVAFTDKRYYLFIENMKINNGTENLYECLEELFAMYYICNMTYPRNCSCTLEFLQRYFLKIHPDYGTKSRRGAHSKHRVLTFINKLKAY